MSKRREHSRSFENALKLFSGQGRPISTADIAAASGVPERSVNAYRSGESDPSWHKALAIMSIMPSQFSAMALRPAGIISVKKACESDGCEFRLNQAATEFLNQLGAYFADGKIDHSERAKLVKQDVPELIKALQSYLAAEEQPNIVRLEKRGTIK